MVRSKSMPAAIIIALGIASSSICWATDEDVPATVNAEGIAQIPAYPIPPSDYISQEARQVFIKEYTQVDPNMFWDFSTRESTLKTRASIDALLQKKAQKMLLQFPVSVTPEMIGGVQTDVVIPKDGVSGRNNDRVLINLHGGLFVFGARHEAQLGSIPAASLGKIKVIAVDYRMAPEYHFPAASEDVAKVYNELLKQYRPENIGIYGCSAGAMLTAEAAAWFQTHGLPSPGALALQGGGATPINRGDSIYFGGAFMGGIASYPPPPRSEPLPHFYFTRSDPSGPLESPVFHPGVLAKFPPTLILNATRDATLSSALYTHAQLTKAGAEADLHVWDGMWHCFFYEASLPEARDSFDVLIRFFDRHLGTRRK